MAKLDYERDYYADLELPPTADIAEIKKQFKKLALKYHPDRNPGREDVVKDKFVVIQAAHEILTDPALKTKVDNYRKRPGSRFSGASGVRGNPYQDLSKEMSDRFGAPPTRHAQTTRPAPTPRTSRYTNWVPPTAKQKMADASDNLRAWDRMRTASGRGNQGTGSTPASPAKPPPPPRTASQARRQEAAFGTKKTGYAPKSPMEGDEPPVTNKNGYTSTHSRTFNNDSANVKTRPASAYVDPLTTQFGENMNFSDNRQRTPYASHIGEKTNPFEGVGVNRAKSARDAFRGNSYDSDTPPPRPRRQRSASVDESDRFKKPGDKTAFESSPASPRHQSRASARYSPHGAGATSAPSSATFAPSSKANTPTNNDGARANGSTSSRAKDGPTVFTVPFDEDTLGPASPSRFMRNSADNINTRFVAEEKAGENYKFNAGGAESPDAFLRAKPRPRSTPRGRQSPQRTWTGSSTESLNTPQREKPPKPNAFNPDEWAGGFEPHHFVPPPAPKPSTSPTRANRAAKKTRPVRLTAGTAGLVDEEGSSSEDKSRPNTAADGLVNGAASPNAMDIDTPPPEPVTPPVAGARTINVEPTKPEWRAGNVNGVKSSESKSGNGTSVPKVLDRNKAGSEDAPDFIRPNLFADFNKVEPFAPPKPGLGSLKDLASNLPFESKAASKLPLETDKPRPVLRQFPAPPVAPRPPTVLGVSSLKPNKQMWDKYVQGFEQYLREWTAFNNKILDHFQARRRVVEDKKFGWAKTGNSYGLQEYVNWLEEDKLVRQKWVAACEAHELHVREMSKNLERMNS